MPTPMRKQYLRLKREYPDTILFFRLGDFYETFDQDAEIVAEICDITLTSRPVGNDIRVPLAGVPHHAAEGYIAKLIRAGHKVAIAEQAGTTTDKGLMERNIETVVTPGTVVEPSLLEAKENSYLAAVVAHQGQAGIAYVDVTTGEFATSQLDTPNPEAIIIQELDRLRPRECLLPEGHEELRQNLEQLIPGAIHLTPYDTWRFDRDNARNALLDGLDVASLEGFGCAHLPLAIQAAGAIIQYLDETRHAALGQLYRLSTYSLDEFMILDTATRRNLELVQTIRDGTVEGSLLGVLEHTVTPMGGRLLRRWLNQPLLDLERLQARHDIVEALFDHTTIRAKLRDLLKQVGDLERLTNRTAQGIATPRNLCNLRQALQVVPAVREALTPLMETCAPLAALMHACRDSAEVVKLIGQAIQEEAPGRVSDGDVIAPGFAPELDSIRKAAQEAKQWIADLETTERERTGIRSLKIGYNKVFGYYIEVTKTHLDKVPETYDRKQTLVNSERYIIPEMKEKEALILNAEERIAELEAQIYHEVIQQVAAHAERMLDTARVLAQLDAHANLAEVAALNNYVRPDLYTDDAIELRGSRHPVVEKTLGAGAFVPNDICLTTDERIMIITGPNMSGKSTVLRQIALIVLLAQIGSFVPADAASISLVDRIFTRVGAQDDIGAGQSTFMVEMVEVANILNNATPRSLLILDEVGRGTSTYDGISLAWATVEYIHNHPQLQAKTLFATHYHELTELERTLPRVRNYNVAIAEDGDDIVFLHRLEPGSADKSYGLHVAQLAGLPRQVIHRAEEILEELESQVSGGSVTPRHVIKEVQQLTLFAGDNPLIDELCQLDVMSMSPLEALNTLFDLQKRAQDGKS